MRNHPPGSLQPMAPCLAPITCHQEPAFQPSKHSKWVRLGVRCRCVPSRVADSLRPADPNQQVSRQQPNTAQQVSIDANKRNVRAPRQSNFLYAAASPAGPTRACCCTLQPLRQHTQHTHSGSPRGMLTATALVLEKRVWEETRSLKTPSATPKARRWHRGSRGGSCTTSGKIS